MRVSRRPSRRNRFRSEVRSASRGGRSLRGRSIICLICDEAAFFTSEGFVVIPANDGAHALERIAAIPVDLVLLDLNMPRKNGWDTFERLSTEHPLVPVIVITARPNQLFTAMGAGVGALLEKPLDMPTLLRTIRRLLAESAEIRLARLAGRAADFHYSAARS